MKSKTLVKQFGYNTLLIECEKQGWRLPTMEEARQIDTPSDCFYINHEEDDNYASVYYPKSGEVGRVHKLFMLESVVVVEPKVCINCDHCDDLSYYCIVLKLYVDSDLERDVTKWGCTEFKRRSNESKT